MRAAAVVCVLALAAGCTAGGPPLGAGSSGDPLVVVPEGVFTETTGPSAPDRDCAGGRFSSLRPPAAVPDPDSVPSVARIRAAGRLRVGLSQSSLLLSHLDPRTGRRSGFEVDLAVRIGAAVFGPGFDADRHLDLVTVDTADRLGVLNPRSMPDPETEIHMVIATLTMTCDRRVIDDVDFSTEYLRAHQRVMVREGGPIASIADLAGRKVCAGRGTTPLPRIAASKAVPTSARDTSDCLVLLQQGDVDAVSTDDVVLAGFRAQDPSAQILDVRFEEGDAGAEPYGIAMRELQPDLIRFVNAVLARLRADGTWARMYAKHLAPALGPAAPPVAVYRD